LILELQNDYNLTFHFGTPKEDKIRGNWWDTEKQSDSGKSNDRSPKPLGAVRNAYGHDSDNDDFMEPLSGQPIKKDLRSSRGLAMRALQLASMKCPQPQQHALGNSQRYHFVKQGHRQQKQVLCVHPATLAHQCRLR
jgi:hypothetical protein